jgi:hypothetical protein
MQLLQEAMAAACEEPETQPSADLALAALDQIDEVLAMDVADPCGDMLDARTFFLLTSIPIRLASPVMLDVTARLTVSFAPAMIGHVLKIVAWWPGLGAELLPHVRHCLGIMRGPAQCIALPGALAISVIGMALFLAPLVSEGPRPSSDGDLGMLLAFLVRCLRFEGNDQFPTASVTVSGAIDLRTVSTVTCSIIAFFVRETPYPIDVLPAIVRLVGSWRGGVPRDALLPDLAG